MQGLGPSRAAVAASGEPAQDSLGDGGSAAAQGVPDDAGPAPAADDGALDAQIATAVSDADVANMPLQDSRGSQDLRWRRRHC